MRRRIQGASCLLVVMIIATFPIIVSAQTVSLSIRRFDLLPTRLFQNEEFRISIEIENTGGSVAKSVQVELSSDQFVISNPSSPYVENVARPIVWPLVWILTLVPPVYSYFSYAPEVGVLMAGVVALGLLTALYLGAPGVVVICILEFNRRLGHRPLRGTDNAGTVASGNH